jgi:hypothetical protein
MEHSAGLLVAGDVGFGSFRDYLLRIDWLSCLNGALLWWLGGHNARGGVGGVIVSFIADSLPTLQRVFSRHGSGPGVGSTVAAGDGDGRGGIVLRIQ